MGNFRVKSTTESGLLVGITVIMALMAVYMPVIGILATLLWPLPIIVLIVRHGMKYGILSIAAAAIIMAVLITPVSAVHMAAAFGPIAMALGYGFRQGFSAARILLYGLLAALAGVLLTAGITLLLTGINPLAMTEQLKNMDEAMAASMEMYSGLGMDAQEQAEVQQQFAASMEFIKLVLPVVFLVSALITAWFNFAIGGKVLRRMGHEVASLPPFTEWRLPRWILFIFAFALIGLYWGTTREIIPLVQVSMNAYVIATIVGIIQGTSLLADLLKGRLRPWLFWLLVIFILFNGFLSQMMAICGLFDMLIDYRRRFQK